MRRLWLTVYLPSLLIAAGQQAVVILLPLYALQLEPDATQAAVLAALWTALRGSGSLVVNIPAGLAVARWGDRAVMLVALGAMAFAGILLGVAASAWAVAAAALLFGASTGAWILARLAYVSEAAPIAYRGRALSSLGGVQRVGLLLGPLAGGFLAVAWGYAAAFFAAAAAAAIGAITIALLTRTATLQQPPTDPGWRIILRLLREHRFTFATAGVASMTLTLLRSSRNLLIPIWGVSIGLDEAAVGVLFTLSSLLEIGMAYPAGALIDRAGHKAAALPCFFLLALSVFVLPFANSLAWFVAAALLAGIGNGLGSGIIMSLGSDYAPSTQRGEFLGVWRVTNDSGAVLGPLMIGTLTAVMSLSLATWTAAAVGGIGFVIMAWVVRAPVRS